ncbi:MAG: GAF domain-containing protein [Flavobacteriales bacterium]|nr:GAF domain-containing protein [Flavobacteriales bacterium]
MSSTVYTSGETKEEVYQELLPQVKGLMTGEDNVVANLANFSAVLKEVFNYHWVGFYLVEGDELVLGPFQGPVACTRLQRGKGVCARAWESKEIQNIPDVDAFPGHVACSALSKSELVIPMINSTGEVWAVLDIDSDQYNDFNEADEKGLSELLSTLNP